VAGNEIYSMVPSTDLTFALAGAGGRGRMFAGWIFDNFGPGVLVAVAEPIEAQRRKIAEKHGIPEANLFESWQEMLKDRRLADVLINTTMDLDHVGSACAAMELGYHMLLEKPLATNLEDATKIDEVRRQTGRTVSVCHSLRYHPVYERVQELLESGAIGSVVSLDQLEAVEHVHQSHSFVRGNWGREETSTFMLLAKSCHDIDVIAWLIDRPCERVDSYGALTHFKRENAPAGAPKFCVEGCPVGDSCPYHAAKVYGVDSDWRYAAGFADLSQREILEELKSSRFGRCVYHCDNDVVDHQVVAMQFANEITATFTMTAFTPWGGRYLRIHGTKGYIEAKIDQNTVDLWEFWAGNRHTHMDIPPSTGGHGGGDDRLIRDLVEAVTRSDASRVRTSTHESVRTHQIVFAAELSRRARRAVEIAELENARKGRALEAQPFATQPT
jgi:predicted dehydrogenase